MRYYKTLIIWTSVLIISILLSLLWGIGDLNGLLSKTILFQVRIPRALEALLAGVGLTLA
ncbi:enterobactin ABC transporter permease, partial [Enterobacter mori]